MLGDASAGNERAAAATAQEIGLLIHDANESTLLALLENPNLDESNVIQLLERLDLSADFLSAIADAKKWNASESVRFRLAKHPHTPRRIALSLLRQLFFFDLMNLSLQPSAPVDLRRSAEAMVLTRSRIFPSAKN